MQKTFLYKNQSGQIIETQDLLDHELHKDLEYLGEKPKPEFKEPSYDWLRRRGYPSVQDQMDMLWHAMDDGILPKVEPFYSEIKAVKDRHPKPSN